MRMLALLMSRGEVVRVCSVLPYWKSTLLPAITSGKRTIIVAHGNSLRALIKHIDNVSDQDIIGLNIPTGSCAWVFGDHVLLSGDPWVWFHCSRAPRVRV